MPNRGIDNSTFSAGKQIGNIYATAANTVYHDFETYSSSEEGTVRTFSNGLDAAIFDSNFLVTATSGATGIGNVSAIAIGGPGIYYSTFHATSGAIGNVYARSVLSNAMYHATIQADLGNVGIVKGVVTGGSGSIASDALEHVVVSAGAGVGGTGYVKGVYGRSASDNGIDHTTVAAGSGGIGYIKGVNAGSIGLTGQLYSSNGIAESTFSTTGAVGAVTGTAGGGSGIYQVTVTGNTIGAISGTTSGYGSGIYQSGFYAAHGITSITGKSYSHLGASGIAYSTFNANTASDNNGSIGFITGTTAGSASFSGSGPYGVAGIYKSTFLASTGITSITGTVTNIYGGSGIANSKFNAAESAGSTGSIGAIRGTTVGRGGSGIASSQFYAEGISSIYGAALGAYSADGIVNVTVNADVNHGASHFGAIDSIEGYSKATHGTGSGILGSTFTAADDIDSIIGTTTAPGSYSYGIGSSHFFASAGGSAITGGSGFIGTITGTSEANGAVGVHTGISVSTFIAGGGPESYGHIGIITGTAKVNGAGHLVAYGIESSAFVAGTDHGNMGNIYGYGKAQGGQVSSATVYAGGIVRSGFYAGTGATTPSGTAGNGTFGTINATGIAESAFGAATANGINESLFVAGGAGTGHIGAITSAATAIAHTQGAATGINASYFAAGTLSGGIGYIGAITATATTHSQGTAYAYGMNHSSVWSGYASGTIAGLSSTAKAYGEGKTVAIGVYGYPGGGSPHHYGFQTVGGYTLRAGSGVAGVGHIGTITGNISATGIATSNDGSATGYGFKNTKIYSGKAKGYIDAVTGIGVATADAGSATAAGFTVSVLHGQVPIVPKPVAPPYYTYYTDYGSSVIKAGTGANGSGYINGLITGNATATSTGGSATATGIYNTLISAGLNHGYVDGVSATANATVTYTNAYEKATAIGINKTKVYAGYSGIYGKIGAITGTATAKIHSSYENGKYSDSATAVGIQSSHFYAQAANGGTAVANGSGAIGKITGTGHAYAYGFIVSASGSGILSSSAIASDAATSVGTIAGVYGYGIAKSTSGAYSTSAVAYGIGDRAGNSFFQAGTGLSSKGTISGRIYGNAQATATDTGDSAATGKAYGLDYANFDAGTGAGTSKGYLPNVEGYAKATAHGAVAYTTAYGIAHTDITAGFVHGVIGNVYGDATAISHSYDGNAHSLSAGLNVVAVSAGFGNLVAYGKIGYVKGLGTADSDAKGIVGNAAATGFGIDGSSTVTAASPNVSGSSAAGTGILDYINGGGYANAQAVGIGASAHAYALGINGLNVSLGYASSTYGIALGGTGTISGNVTATAESYAKSVNVGGSTIAKSTGIAGLNVHLGDAVGVTYAKGGTGSMGNIIIDTYAKAYGAAKTYAYDYATDTVLFSAGNATAGATPTDIAKGGSGTIGAFESTTYNQYAKAIAGDSAGSLTNTGIAKAVAEPLSTLKVLAGNAYGGVAYGGTGFISFDDNSYSGSKAYASGYSAATTAIGFRSVRLSAGNAQGGYYAKGGTGNIGQFEGEAKAYSTLVAITPATLPPTYYAGATSTATAYGIKGIQAYSGNAVITNPAATLSAFGGHGEIGGFLGYAYAKAYASKTPFTTPQAGASTAKAYGLKTVYAYAGNAANFGSGPAKSYYGKIGYFGYIVGKATANAGTTGGGTASSKAYAHGVEAISLNAANAVTYGGGKAIATKAYAYINVVKGYGTAVSNAYGKTDPTAKSEAYGVEYITLRAGNAFVEHGGTSNAYAAGWQGLGTSSPGYQAIIQGIIAKGSATATAKGTSTTASPTTAYARSFGLGAGTKSGGFYARYAYIQAANAFTKGNAYGGLGYIGTNGAGVGIHGTATSLATATAINTILPDPTSGTAKSYGIINIKTQAGDAVSYGKTADAHADGNGEIGATTGITKATASATGGAATTVAIAYGLTFTNLYAGSAFGNNAYAGLGTIGAVSGTGKAYGTSKFLTYGNPTVTTVDGYGMKHVTLDAGYAVGNNYADGDTATITSITGTGKAIAYGNGGAGNVYAYSSGVKNTYAFAGGASGANAQAGTGIIGATIGSGYAKAGGSLTDHPGKAKAKSFGIDPVKLYAGTAFGTTYSKGGAGSSVGATTGTAVSKAYGYSAVGYSYGINALTVLVGDARTSGTAPGDEAYAKSGTIGAVSGSATTTVKAYDSGSKAIGIARGIVGSTFSAATAYGYYATGAKGVIKTVYGTAVDNVTGTTDSTTGLYASTSYGIDSVGLSAGVATGNGTGSKAYGAEGVVGYIYGTATVGLTGVANGATSQVYAGKIAGISHLTVYAGTATSNKHSYAGTGYIATAAGYVVPTSVQGINGKGYGISGIAKVTLNANEENYSGKFVHEFGTRGIYNSTFNAGYAKATATDPGYAHANVAVIGSIYGGASSTFTSISDGTEATNVIATSGIFDINVRAGYAHGIGTADADSGTLGNVKGKALVTFDGTTHNNGIGMGVHETYGIEQSHINVASALASSSYSTAVANGATGNVGNMYGYAKVKLTSATATGTGATDIYVTEAIGMQTVSASVGTATAYLTASAGAGTVGAFTGKGYIDIASAQTAGNGSTIVSDKALGLQFVHVFTGGAYASQSNAASVATAKTGAIGTITADAYANITGATTGTGGDIGAKGINGVNQGYFYGGNATGYSATSATSIISTAGFTAKAISTVAATTSYASTSLYSGVGPDQLIALDNVHIIGSVANGSQSTSGIAHAGSATATIGYVMAVASGTVTDGGSHVGAIKSYTKGIDALLIHAASAYGATATGGAGAVGFIYGKATADAAVSAAIGAIVTKAYGVQTLAVNAGYADSTSATGNATADSAGSSVGALTGKAYATSTGSQAALAITNSATAYGISAFSVNVATATGYKAYGAAGTITSLYGKETASATGYSANATGTGAGTLGFANTLSAGVSTGGTASGAHSHGGQGTIGNLTGISTDTASANSTDSGSVAYTHYSLAIASLAVNSGNASGYGATASLSASSTIGAVSATATISDTGYYAHDFAGIGAYSLHLTAGYSKANHGHATAGNDSYIAKGGTIYGYAKVGVYSEAAGATGGKVFGRGAAGLLKVTANAASATSGASTGDEAFAQYGKIGGFKGKALTTATTTAGTSAKTAFDYGISQSDEYAGNANATGYAEAGAGVLGAIYGKATAHLDGGVPTVAAYATGTNSVDGITGSNFTIGYAKAGSTHKAVGGSGSSIVSIRGEGYAYATASNTAGIAKANAYGLSGITVSAGNAVSGALAYAGTATIGYVFGVAKAKATGFAATTISEGIDPTTFTVSDATHAASGSIGSSLTTGIYGYAYSSAQSHGGSSHSHAYGFKYLTATVSYGSVTSGSVVGAIGFVSPTARSFSNDSGAGTGHAYAVGIYGGALSAGYKQSATSSINNVDAIAVASNSAGIAPHTYTGIVGSHGYAAAITSKNTTTHSTFYSGGTIGTVTGNSYTGTAAAGNGSSHKNFLSVYSATFKAGASIGNISVKSNGTGVHTDAIHLSNFVAGTTIGNIYALTNGNSGAIAIYNSDFRAIDTGFTGATAAIGTIKAYSPNAPLQYGGVIGSVFTTAGSIGAVTIHGSFINPNAGIFAGDDLGVGYVVGGASTQADHVVSGASIASVTITGYLMNADIIASTNAGAGTSFGSSSDTSAGGGSIGAINITKPASGMTAANATGATSDTFAIEAASITSVTWGNVGSVNPAANGGEGTVISGSGKGNSGSPIRVRNI